jgi:hypothetical protein
MASGWRLAIERVEPWIHPDHSLRERRVAPDKGGDRVGQHLFRDAAHFGNLRTQALEVRVESLDGVVGHCRHGRLRQDGRSDQPKRPVM